MLKEIEIQNFRCFEHIKISGFERVNLIGGKNNAGKTALLEAIFLYNDPDGRSIFALKKLRIESSESSESSEWIDSIYKREWDNLFYSLNKDAVIVIHGKDESNVVDKIEIWLDESGNVDNIFSDKNVERLRELFLKDKDDLSVLNIKLTQYNRETVNSVAIATSSSKMGFGSRPNVKEPPFIPSCMRSFERNLTELFDLARLNEKDSEVLKAF